MATLAIPLAIAGISALSGLFSNRSKKLENESKSTQTQNINELTAPEYDEKTRIMRDILMHQYLDRTQGNEDFFSGYRAQGLNNINQTANIGDRNIENILSSRGLLGRTGGVSSFVGNQFNRLNQQSSFLNSIPLLADQRQQTLLNDASGFFKGLPVAQRRTGTNTAETITKGSQTQPGNMLGGAFGGLGSALAGLYGSGAFGGGKKPIIPGPSEGYDPYGGLG